MTENHEGFDLSLGDNPEEIDGLARASQDQPFEVLPIAGSARPYIDVSGDHSPRALAHPAGGKVTFCLYNDALPP